LTRNPHSQKHPLDLDAQLSDLSIVLNFANASFHLWWQFCNKDFVDSNQELINDLDRYFFYSRESHLFSFVVRICILFDKGNNLSLLSAYKEATKRRIISSETKLLIEDQLDKARPIAAKVMVLRHNIMAHKSKHMTFKYAYAEASISPDAMRELIGCSTAVLNHLLHCCSKPSLDFHETFLNEDISELLRRLTHKLSP
jgi:AbiU2